MKVKNWSTKNIKLKLKFQKKKRNVAYKSKIVIYRFEVDEEK